MSGGGIKRRSTWRIAMPDGFNPAPILERFDDLRGDRHPADVLDIPSGNGLAVSDDREGLHGGAGISRGFVILQPGKVFTNLGSRLETPARSKRNKLHPASNPLALEVLKKQTDGVCIQFIVEQPLELGDGHRGPMGEQGSLKNLFGVGRIHIQCAVAERGGFEPPMGC